ncbi:MAG: PBP1A family penicillin-binding protein [Desulfobacteraceae bacterium]|nr:MAG: PBP1A family penicillin-binding protein [Desulfobacteraceae bacterium]
MKDRKSPRFLLPLFKGTVCLVALLLLGTGFYGWHLSKEIENRFSSRRWRIPSKVYSDSVLFFPGQRIDRKHVLSRLRKLNYRLTDSPPARKGEMRQIGETLELFLHDLNLPFRKRAGFQVKIAVNDHEIVRITHLRSDEEIPLLELEPEELMLFFDPEREERRLISISQVPKHVRDSFLAAEDADFYRHFGIDPLGILRALYVNLKEGRIVQGGSTITQQLAKNYFLTPERTAARKLKETLMAVVLEVMYEKNEILEIYFNEIYLGQKGSVAINGLGEASYFYFAKPVSELSLEEGAAIAGLVKAPNHYSPYVDRERCRERRNTVLKIMSRLGWISRQSYESAASLPVSAAGFHAYGKKAPYFMDYLSTQLRALYPKEALSSLGLSIFTTLDTEVQSAAEKALSDGLARIEKEYPSLMRKDPDKKLQGAVIVMQPKTGYLLAMVGGRDYTISQFNRAVQARRQPGSAFKPFVFLCGLDRYSPVSRLSNAPASYEVDGKIWRPQNDSFVEGQTVTLRTAIARSVNLGAVDLAMKIGIEEIAGNALRFGFSTPLKPYPSLALGALEVVPLELARAYCPFAADGMLPFPLSLKDVADENGKILEGRHMRVENVTSPAKAYMMSSLLRSAVTDGTARSLKKYGITQPVAGKTGTTNDSRDAWFVGYTPDMLALVWIGFDDQTPMQGAAATLALPIWADLVKKIPQFSSGGWFQMPPGIFEKTVCSESGQIAVRGQCPNPLQEIFLENQLPAGTCPLHGMRNPLKRILEEVRDFVDKL